MCHETLRENNCIIEVIGCKDTSLAEIVKMSRGVDFIIRGVSQKFYKDKNWVVVKKRLNDLVTMKSGLPVGNDACAFMHEEMYHVQSSDTLRCSHRQHSLPNPREVTQVEDVVKLGWGRQHLDLKTDEACLRLFKLADDCSQERQ